MNLKETQDHKDAVAFIINFLADALGSTDRSLPDDKDLESMSGSFQVSGTSISVAEQDNHYLIIVNNQSKQKYCIPNQVFGKAYNEVEKVLLGISESIKPVLEYGDPVENSISKTEIIDLDSLTTTHGPWEWNRSSHQDLANATVNYVFDITNRENGMWLHLLTLSSPYYGRGYSSATVYDFSRPESMAPSLYNSICAYIAQEISNPDVTVDAVGDMDLKGLTNYEISQKFLADRLESVSC